MLRIFGRFFGLSTVHDGVQAAPLCVRHLTLRGAPPEFVVLAMSIVHTVTAFAIVHALSTIVTPRVARVVPVLWQALAMLAVRAAPLSRDVHAARAAAMMSEAR